MADDLELGPSVGMQRRGSIYTGAAASVLGQVRPLWACVKPNLLNPARSDHGEVSSGPYVAGLPLRTIWKSWGPHLLLGRPGAVS